MYFINLIFTELQTSQEILLEYFGYESFREPQQAIIQSVLDGKDTLALLPTGAGKSLCFQVPALMKDGICVVISPLIALMKDQVFQLKRRNIKAAAIFSGLSFNEIDIILDNCQFGYYKFLYVSPERLKTDIFIERFKQMNVNLIAVDEAHCISQWGFDFRPPYLEIADIRKYHPKVPVLALTATATQKVQNDITEKLAFKKQFSLFKKSFQRPNISFVVRREEAKYPKLIDIITTLNGSGIVYVRSRNKTKDVAEYLQKNNIRADFYHAGLKQDERNRKQDNWIKDKTNVIVCTNAFGMGIDKADVRFVIHLDIPETMEAYYQEAGRAGRDGKLSYAALLFNQNDIDLLIQKKDQKFPAVDDIKRVYNAICNYFKIAVGSGKMLTRDFDIYTFSKLFNIDVNLSYNCLKILEQEGYMQLSESIYMPSRVVFRVDKHELYKFQVANADADLLIKALLRNYGGIIDHYSKINEQLLAKQLKLSTDEVTDRLKVLQKNKILTYIAANEEPTITLLTERLHEDYLRINTQYINERKKITDACLQAIINYTQQDKICRQAIICSYFGESNTVRCNRCDVCLEENKKLHHSEDFKHAKEFILKSTAENWMPMDALLPKAHFENLLYKEVVRFLLDEKLVIVNNKNELKKNT
ncbi:MAG: ATP-dependent DNA helicase RecQ [Chitinophagales bacterium]